MVEETINLIFAVSKGRCKIIFVSSEREERSVFVYSLFQSLLLTAKIFVNSYFRIKFQGKVMLIKTHDLFHYLCK